MILLHAFRELNRHMRLVLYPIVVDLIALVIGIALIGFHGGSQISSKLLLEMGLPSVSHILNEPLLMNTTAIFEVTETTTLLMALVVLLMVLLGTFMQGGYISSLANIAEKKPIGFGQFLKDGKKYWVRFIFLYIIIFLGKIAVTTFLALFYGVIGVFAAFAFFMILRIFFIYFEFIVVVNNINIDRAFKKSWQYLKVSFIKSFALIAVLYIVSGSISLLVHWYWSLTFVVGTIFFYGYIMTGIQLAFMMLLLQTKEENKDYMLGM